MQVNIIIIKSYASGHKLIVYGSQERTSLIMTLNNGQVLYGGFCCYLKHQVQQLLMEAECQHSFNNGNNPRLPLLYSHRISPIMSLIVTNNTDSTMKTEVIFI